jgi:hypothetical protein
VDNQNGTIGMSAIARDQDGNVLAMVCGGRQYIKDPIMAEALVIYKAVELSNLLALQSFILEGNAINVVHVLNQEELCRGEYG